MGREYQHYFHQKYYKLLGILFLTVVVFSCQEKKDTRKTVHVSGHLKNYSNDYLFFEELTPTDLILKDSIIVNDLGYFEFDFQPPQTGFYRLGLSATDFITLVLKPGESIFIEADADGFNENYVVEGSECSVLYKDINRHVRKGMKKADSLRQLYRAQMHRNDFATIQEDLKKEYDRIREDQRNYMISFIHQNSYSLTSILALYQYFENHILLDEEKDFSYFLLVSDHLSEIHPSNKHVIDLKKRVNDRLREQQENTDAQQSLEPGAYAPEIILSDPDGENISLSSLRGQIVLIDFWAAWCPPCRKQNIEMKSIYEKYKNLGFEIYAVSLDRTHQKWVEAIEEDKINWIHVSDLRFMNSPIVDLYNITEIPYEILIDRQGKIISKDISLDNLEKLISDHL